MARSKTSLTSSGGYERLFGGFAPVLTFAQSASIKSGLKLESLLWAMGHQVDDLDKFVSRNIPRPSDREDCIWLAHKKQIKSSKVFKSVDKDSHEPDFLGLDLGRRICHVIEIKAGTQYDTKKAEGEFKALCDKTNHIARQLPFTTKFWVCAFNSKNLTDAYDGFKRKIPTANIILGPDLCRMLSIDYRALQTALYGDKEENIKLLMSKFMRTASQTYPELLNQTMAERP